MWTSSLVLAVLVLTAIEETVPNPTKERVCVIGTGPAGLTATKFLADQPDKFEGITFEKNSDVGGMWIYSDSTTVDEHGLPVHSSAYRLLRVNVPKELLAFPEYPEFRGENVSFVRHDTVMQYLRNYTDHFNLRQHIRFNTNVEKVRPLPETEDRKWVVIVRDLITQKISKIRCDAMILAHGHFVKGNIPKIRGIESFTGQHLHSHLYRRPEDYANKIVVILGASYSGQDLAVQCSQYATKVYLSHRHAKLITEFPPNVEQVAGVVGSDCNELILRNGSRIKADVLLYSTGFLYDFPFLNECSGITTKGKHIVSVYKHLINIERPSMAILGIPKPRLAFVGPHAQVAYFLAYLQGKVKLPSREKMLEDAELPRGVRESKAHVVNADIFKYYNELAEAAGYPTLPSWFMEASDETTRRIFADPLHFRQNNLVLRNDGTFEFIRHNDTSSKYT